MTLRRYHTWGCLTKSRQPGGQDIIFIIKIHERQLRAITNYIDKRFDQIEKEKTGKGFVITVYRRRRSSPTARQAWNDAGKDSGGLQMAYDWYLQEDDVPAFLESDDLPKRWSSKVSSATLRQGLQRRNGGS
jgi:hypothetical protein